ncbi:15741_t:CDS:2, partial [Funneliformis geosporum]
LEFGKMTTQEIGFRDIGIREFGCFGVNIDKFLDDSDEEDGYRTPLNIITQSPTFKTPKSENIKDVINGMKK